MSQDSRPGRPTLRVANEGLVAVSLKIDETLDKGVPGCVLAAVSAKDKAAAEKATQNAERKRKLLAALASKEEAELSGMTREQIEAEIAKVDA